MTPTTPQPRGRPRDAGLDVVVLRATTDLLRERGYYRLRVGDVAVRAGVGLGAIYRRWASKRDLVLAALVHVVPDRATPVTDDPAADVLAGLRAVNRALAGPSGRLLGGLLPAMQDDDELADAVREQLLAAVRAGQRERVRRLLGDVPDLDVRADLGPAYLLFHGLFLGREVLEDELHSLLDVIASVGSSLQTR